jgi:hypothetical protein
MLFHSEVCVKFGVVFNFIPHIFLNLVPVLLTLSRYYNLNAYEGRFCKMIS